MGLGYRLKQFWRIAGAGPLTVAARDEISGVLSEPERILFDNYSHSDQWHCYRVLRTLREAGHEDTDLLTAALLHDIGKSRVGLSIWDRSLIVLAQAFAPSRVEEWSKGDLDGWRRPFVVRGQHPIWGAEMAEAAGSRQRVVSLIRRHQEALIPGQSDDETQLLQWLQWADNQN